MHKKDDSEISIWSLQTFCLEHRLCFIQENLFFFWWKSNEAEFEEWTWKERKAEMESNENRRPQRILLKLQNTFPLKRAYKKACKRIKNMCFVCIRTWNADSIYRILELLFHYRFCVSFLRYHLQCSFFLICTAAVTTNTFSDDGTRFSK